jgi:hypothetical protein
LGRSLVTRATPRKPGAACPDLQALPRPCPKDWLTAYAAGTCVRNPQNAGPAYIKPAAVGRRQGAKGVGAKGVIRYSS